MQATKTTTKTAAARDSSIKEARQAAPPARRVIKPADWTGVIAAAAEERAAALRAALMAQGARA